MTSTTMELAIAFAEAHGADMEGCRPFTNEKEAALEQRIKELERDALRLEHLCQSVRCMGAYVGGNHTWGFLFGKGWKTGATFREAIDRAISEAALDKMREISEELKLP